MSYKSILATVVTVLALSLPAEAQFLEKLTKGLDKVNKGLDKANQSLDKVFKLDETLKKQEKKSEKSASSEKGSQNQTGTKQTSSVDVSGWKEVEPTYPTPQITAETKFMIANPDEDNISDIHDGVFAVKRESAFEFWKVTGEKLFDAEWKYAGELRFGAAFPTFSNGVAAARRTKPNANGQTPIYLLYLDGRIKELDPSWETVSQFMDGVALVTKQVNYREQAFYIDIAGNRLYPNLKVEKGRRNPMRPLRDGLRAYCNIGGDPVGYVWGFIDNKGNVKITPRYKEVTDFANGYAWASTKEGTKELIDVTGKVVFTLNIDYTTTDVSDNGVFCVAKSDKNTYYDLEGKELASYQSCSGFYKGYAFIAQGYEDAEVIDRNFNIIKRMLYNYCNAVDVNSQSPNFKPYGLATVNTGTTVIAPNGQIVLTSYENHKDTAFGGFRQFAESGYMKATNCNVNGERCMALVKPSGEIAWIFSNNPLGKSVDSKQKPKGPITTDKLSFTVNVLASPAEGGSVSVSPKGKVEYGKEATISVSPNKDWAVRSIETDAEDSKAPESGKPFAVFSDQTVTVNFVKKETEEAPDNFGFYLGQITFEGNPIPVYAEINQKGAETNPYGADNYGFMAAMFDPEKRYVDKKGEVAANMFAVPFKIVGIQKDAADPAKRWLIVEGGSFTGHNIVVNPNGNALLGLMVNGLLLVNDYTTVTAQSRRYRIEMLDRNPETGEFLFGKLETYSVKAGTWVPGDDPSLREKTGGFMISYTDRGFQPDTFKGARMKKTQKRNDILWYPPQSWFKDQESYQKILKSMESSYQNDKSDYEQLFAR